LGGLHINVFELLQRFFV